MEASGADILPCDSDLLSAALSNLLDNAVRHGARRIHVHASLDGAQVQLTLRDNGSGIPPDQRERLQQALDAQGPQEGLGLGLTLADMVARTHGGRLKILAPDLSDPALSGAAIAMHWPAQWPTNPPDDA